MNQFLGCTIISVENFCVIFARDYRTFFSNSCWLHHVAELIIRVNPLKKVCFFSIFWCARGISVFTMKIFLVKILFVSLWMILLHYFFVKFFIFYVRSPAVIAVIGYIKIISFLNAGEIRTELANLGRITGLWKT